MDFFFFWIKFNNSLQKSEARNSLLGRNKRRDIEKDIEI